MIKETIFWCEFPEEVNWVKVNKEINFKTEIYIASKNRYDFLKYKKKITNKNIEVGVWPVLDKEDGYWFSGFVSQKNIDKLDDFSEFNIKIDVEPPIIEGKGSFLMFIRYFLKYLFKKGTNNDYLAQKINNLKNKKIIIGPIAPKIYMRRYVDKINKKNKLHENYIFYTPIIPRYLRFLFRFYYKIWFKNKEPRNKYLALGPMEKGIFGEEASYKNTDEFKKDFDFAEKLGFEKIVIFNLEGLFNRKDSKEFLEIIRKVK